jgi:hypothetical protein
MEPFEAENCMRNIARIVKPGGYLFVTGNDVDIREKAVRNLHWPIPKLIGEIQAICSYGETGPVRGGDWSLSTPKEKIGTCATRLFSS